MKTNWDLTVFYKDFDDPEFKDDLARLPKDKKEKHKNCTKNEQNGKIPLLKSCILHYN